MYHKRLTKFEDVFTECLNTHLRLAQNVLEEFLKDMFIPMFKDMFVFTPGV